MTRSLRVEYEGAWYHVTSRGNERKEIYRDDKDRERFVGILRRSAEESKVEVACYVLMSNHFHFLLQTPVGNLAKFMQRFNTTYTMYYNRRHKRNGHLLQGRYKGILVEADEYLLEVSRYIHLNPVKIRKNRELSIEEKKRLLAGYRWSSYRGYIGKAKDDFVNYGAVLGYLGGGDGERRRKYERFMMDGIGEDLSEIYKEVKGQAVLGGEVFLKWVQEHFDEGREIKEKDVSHKRELKKRLSIEEIAKATAEEYGAGVEEILARRSRQNEARQVTMELSYRINGGRMSLRELGKAFGGMGGDAILQAHKRFLKRLNQDKDLMKRFEKMERTLSQ